MQINSINNAQSFGMACRVGKGLKNAMKKTSNDETSRQKLEEVKTTCASLDSMPQQFYLNITKDYKKICVKLMEGNEVVSTRLYSRLKPKKVLNDMCKDISKHAQEAGKKQVVKDAIENNLQYFDTLGE